MSRGARIFVIVLSILVLAAILLFVFSRCNRNDTVQPSPSSSAEASLIPSPSSTVEAPSASPSPTPSPSSIPEESASANPSTPAVSIDPGRPETIELDIQADEDTRQETATLVIGDFGTGIRSYTYSLYCLQSSYTAEAIDGGERYSSTQTANCFLELCFQAGDAAQARLPSFLDDYLNYTSIEYIGDYHLPCGLLTQCARASDGSLTYEAYLADGDGGVLCFILCYPNDAAETEAPRLHAMLDSFQLVD